MTFYATQIITEVSKREVLWNRCHDNYSTRILVNKAWKEVAEALEKEKDEVKSKWRNLRDQYTREVRKVNEFGEYIGKWVYFDQLHFLRENMVPAGVVKGNEGFEETYLNENNQELRTIVKDEIDDNQGTSDMSEQIEFVEDDSEMILSTSARGVKRKLPQLELKFDNQKFKDDSDEDADMHFVKSLVPFLKKLKPVRKLVIRNKMQSLLIKELLCENCRLNGQQPYCPCITT